MKRILILIGALLVLQLAASPAMAMEDLAQTVLDGCKKELKSYCEGVTPGEGRILACLYAYGDKLSGQCEWALYDAAAQLERAIAALTYVTNECANDLNQFCANVAAGEGRLVKCIEQNKDKISKRCSQAIKDVDLKSN